MATQTSTQFQHFVPQFLLRNFAHDFVPPPTAGKKKKKRKPSFDKSGLRMYPGDKVVHNVNLTQTPYVIDESPVRRILGRPDMYNDNNKPTKEERSEVERMFSTIEDQAQRVLRRITKAYENGDTTVNLPRADRDLLRKFLFLLKFRGAGFHNRFAHEAIDEYDADDRKLFQAYMRKHNFTRPIEVWLRSLKTIMDLKMDPGREWIQEINRCMYRGDAMWFVSHVQSSYMAICTPKDKDDEFILTDNSYNVFEGPNHSALDMKTGKTMPMAHANLHNFAPVSSKLMILLRSYVLPVPEEDAGSEEIRREREASRHLALDDVFGPGVESVLQDLPITKARNSYSHISDGRFVGNSDFSGTFSMRDTFYFSLFPLESEHVHKINKVLLENTYNYCSRIVFGTQTAFLRTLTWYLEQPKAICGEDVELMEAHLQKLKTLTVDLGLSVKALWWRIPVPPVQDFSRHRETMETFHEMLEDLLEQKATSSTDSNTDAGDIKLRTFFSRYKVLYKKQRTEYPTKRFDPMDDWHQTYLMQRLQTLIEVEGRRVDKKTRERNRYVLSRLYLQIPPSRMWLYSKRVRMMLGLGLDYTFAAVQPFAHFLSNEKYRDGPEDVFVDAQEYIRPNRLNNLVHTTVLIQTKLSNLEDDIWNSSSNWIESVMKFTILSHYALKVPGKLRDCGIQEIEKLAVTCEKVVINQQMHKQYPLNDPVYEEEDRIEIATRILTQKRFPRTKLATVHLDADVAQRLEQVLFRYTYMTPSSVVSPA